MGIDLSYLRILTRKWVLFYIGSIVLSNLLLMILPPIQILQSLVPPAIFASGFVFVLRDFAQNQVGHKVLIAMVVATVLTYLLAGPAVAIASSTAFLVAELADWLIFTATKKPLADRILISSVISVPVDTLVFYHLLGILDFPSLTVGVGIKMVAAIGFWVFLKYRERVSKLNT